jgi:DegV family protein with EDD domain
MTRVAIVTDSASDLDPAAAASAGVTVVPLTVSFGDEEFRTGVDITISEFYQRLLAPGAPFPRTAACPPAAFQAEFERLLTEGADAVVCITVGGRLSATQNSARLARDAMPTRPVHVIDSDTASMSLGLLALLGAEASAAGEPAASITRLLEARRRDARLYVALHTLEYLRRGGRISAAQAAIGSVLSVKPIITVADGVVETTDKPRTNGKARLRLLELLTAQPLERIAVLHTGAPDADAFAAELAARANVDRADMSVGLIGPTVAPHVGPGAIGAAFLARRS